MKTNLLAVITLFIATASFQGCGKYSPSTLASNKKTIQHYSNEPSAPVAITLTSDNELTPDSHFLAFQQINLAITNTTSDSYTLNGNSFSLPLASAQSIQDKAPSCYVQHLIPCSIFLAGTFLFYWQACLPLALFSGIAGFCCSKKTNQNQERELHSLLVEPEQTYTIAPKSSSNFLLCIEKTDYKPEFYFSLINNTTKVPTLIEARMQSQTSTVFTTQ